MTNELPIANKVAIVGVGATPTGFHPGVAHWRLALRAFAGAMVSRRWIELHLAGARGYALDGAPYSLPARFCSSLALLSWGLPRAVLSNRFEGLPSTPSQ